MTESLFDRYTKLTNKSRELKSFSIEPKLSTCAVKPCPEVISFDEEKYRLSVLQKTFQICTHSLKFDSIKVILGAFQTFDKAQQNTAIGVRFTGAYTLEGENLMDPKFCIERDNVRQYYVNHDNGFVTHNRGMDYRIPLQDDSRWKAVDHVCGEVLVSYSPGYEIYKIRKENELTTVAYSDLSFNLDAYDSSVIQISVTPENLAGYRIEAYDTTGMRLMSQGWCRYPVFEGDKTAVDFTEETLPNNKAIKKYIYTFAFKGEIDKADLYIAKPEQRHWLPIKTAAKPPANPSWDDFKDVVNGPILPKCSLIDFKSLDEKDLNDAIHCEFKRGEAILEMNDVIIQVNLPVIENTILAKYTFEDVLFGSVEKNTLKKLLTFKSQELKSVSFSYTTHGICGFSYQDSNSLDERELKVVPQKTRFTGKVAVAYPSKIDWLRISKDSPKSSNGHEVKFEGGLITYIKPSDYNLPKIESGYTSYFIRAYNVNGDLLQLEKFDHFYDTNAVRFGFWGQVDSVEIALCREWVKIEKEFDLICGDKIKGNPAAEEMMEFFSNL